MTILDELAKYAKKRVAEEKQKISLEEIKKSALSMSKGDFFFEKALRKDDIAFICECKKASPSKDIPLCFKPKRPGEYSKVDNSLSLTSVPSGRLMELCSPLPVLITRV